MRSDAELLVSYGRHGDVAAFEELVRRHSRWLAALLRGLAPESEAEDALQETWLRVIRAAGRFRGGSVRAFLATTARRVAIDRLRACRDSVSLDAAGEDGLGVAETLADESQTPVERFESAATSAEVREAVHHLATGPKQVLLLRIEAELSFREIADELGVPLGTALTWMHVATMRLKRELGAKS